MLKFRGSQRVRPWSDLRKTTTPQNVTAFRDRAFKVKVKEVLEVSLNPTGSGIPKRQIHTERKDMEAKTA